MKANNPLHAIHPIQTKPRFPDFVNINTYTIFEQQKTAA